MAHVDTASLIAQAVDAAQRANFVRQDPAVVKAAKQALGDIARAGNSTTKLLFETRDAWQRLDRRHR
jgi:hypothetical protein